MPRLKQSSQQPWCGTTAMTISWETLCQDKCGDPCPQLSTVLPSSHLCSFAPAQGAHQMLREEPACRPWKCQLRLAGDGVGTGLAVLVCVPPRSAGTARPACYGGRRHTSSWEDPGLVPMSQPEGPVLVPGPRQAGRVAQGRPQLPAHTGSSKGPWSQPLCHKALGAAARGLRSLPPPSLTHSTQGQLPRVPSSLKPRSSHVESKGPRPPTHARLCFRDRSSGPRRLGASASAGGRVRPRSLPPRLFTNHPVRHVPGSHWGWLRWF